MDPTQIQDETADHICEACGAKNHPSRGECRLCAGAIKHADVIEARNILDDIVYFKSVMFSADNFKSERFKDMVPDAIREFEPVLTKLEGMALVELRKRGEL